AAPTWWREGSSACSGRPCCRPTASAAPSSPPSRWRRSSPPTISRRWWRGSEPIRRLRWAPAALTFDLVARMECRSPDGAKRNPGFLPRARRLPHSAALHAGYELQAFEDAPMTSNETALPIDVVSDVVCPWCFIGKRLLETAIALKPEIPVVVRFRPYFLNPWIPREGISRDEYLTTKFGSGERCNRGASPLAEAAGPVRRHE